MFAQQPLCAPCASKHILLAKLRQANCIPEIKKKDIFVSLDLGNLVTCPPKSNTSVVASCQGSLEIISPYSSGVINPQERNFSGSAWLCANNSVDGRSKIRSKRQFGDLALNLKASAKAPMG